MPRPEAASSPQASDLKPRRWDSSPKSASSLPGFRSKAASSPCGNFITYFDESIKNVPHKAHGVCEAAKQAIEQPENVQLDV